MAHALTDMQRALIRQQQDGLSAKQIAVELRLDRQLVRDYLDEIRFRKNHRRQRVFALLAVAIPILALALLEAGLRLFDYGDDLRLVQRRNILGQDYFVLNENIARRYFPANTPNMPALQEDFFAVDKSPNTIRIFCLGGSTTAGFPFALNANFPDLLDDRLTTLMPEHQLEVVNAGVTALNSYAVLDFVQELVDYQPDAFVIYMGHNEFYGALGAGSTVRWGGGRTAIRLYQKLQHFKVVQLWRSALSVLLARSVNGHPDNRTLMQDMAGKQEIPYDSEVYRQAREDFRANLTATISIARSHGAQVLISNLVSNENGMAPFAWQFDARTSAGERQAWQALYQQATQLLEAGQTAEALTLLQQAAAVDESPAILHYQIGKCLEARGDFGNARVAYRRARDLDLLRFRASSEFNQILSEVSRAQTAAFLDMDSVFAAHSLNGIIGNELLTEHLHPNFDGYFLMAKALTRALADHQMLAPTDAWHWERDKSDEDYRAIAGVTDLDEMLARYKISLLTRGWPFKQPLAVIPEQLDEQEQRVLAAAQQIYLDGTKWHAVRHDLAQYYFDHQDYERAAGEYRAIVKTVPWDFRALLKLGDLALVQQQFEAARAWYNAAVGRKPHSAAIVAKLGIVDLMQNQFESGKRRFERALDWSQRSHELDRKSELEARYFLAVCYLQLGEHEPARAQLDMIVAAAPDHSKALELLRQINGNPLAQHAE